MNRVRFHHVEWESIQRQHHVFFGDTWIVDFVSVAARNVFLPTNKFPRLVCSALQIHGPKCCKKLDNLCLAKRERNLKKEKNIRLKWNSYVREILSRRHFDAANDPIQDRQLASMKCQSIRRRTNLTDANILDLKFHIHSVQAKTYRFSKLKIVSGKTRNDTVEEALELWLTCLETR